MDIEKEGVVFEQWWGDEGQYHRAGGNGYCKTFAWESWIFAKVQASKQFENFIDQAIEDSACADERRSLQTLLDEFQDNFKARAIPDGFVLVPKEPTQKMLDATINVPIPAVYVDSISGHHKLKVAAYYKAMIGAQE